MCPLHHLISELKPTDTYARLPALPEHVVVMPVVTWDLDRGIVRTLLTQAEQAFINRTHVIASLLARLAWRIGNCGASPRGQDVLPAFDDVPMDQLAEVVEASYRLQREHDVRNGAK